MALKLDKYARDAQSWRFFANDMYVSSAALFAGGEADHLFAAAMLGHYALEMYLKAALICAGMAVFDPRKIGQLDPAEGLTKADCAWGHSLACLAGKLSERQDLKLDEHLNLSTRWPSWYPMSIRKGLELFDPFFEVRYPKEEKQLEVIGPHQKIVLDALVEFLKPYSSCDK